MLRLAVALSQPVPDPLEQRRAAPVELFPCLPLHKLRKLPLLLSELLLRDAGATRGIGKEVIIRRILSQLQKVPVAHRTELFLVLFPGMEGDLDPFVGEGLSG